MKSRIDQQINFLKEIGKFKEIERKIYYENGRAETDAEHSWHLAMFLIMFEKDLPTNLDFLKMLKMALIHDLVEIYAGDTFCYDKIERQDKKERESKAAQKLFSTLPLELEKNLADLFWEYEKGQTQEAKIVKSFDKLQPILQNLTTAGKTWKMLKIKYSDIVRYKSKFMTHNKLIQKIYQKLLKEIKKRKLA